MRIPKEVVVRSVPGQRHGPLNFSVPCREGIFPGWKAKKLSLLLKSCVQENKNNKKKLKLS
jgi:hypothetical protein